MSGQDMHTKLLASSISDMVQEWYSGKSDVAHMTTAMFAERISRFQELRTPDPAQIRADALREAAALMEVAATNCRAAFTYPPRTKEERDYQTAALVHTYARDAILALIGTPLSPTAVDGSPAPDDGGKEGV